LAEIVDFMAEGLWRTALTKGLSNPDHFNSFDAGEGAQQRPE
jgi:hypothetical protein